VSEDHYIAEIERLKDELRKLQEALAKVTTMETLKHMGYRQDSVS
jgi:hypothetical protein